MQGIQGDGPGEPRNLTKSPIWLNREEFGNYNELVDLGDSLELPT